jgi:DNA adenine methylase
MNNVSPLRYPGGKTRACTQLDSIINTYFTMDEYENIVSPFFGGGSFEFYLQNKYKYKIHGDTTSNINNISNISNNTSINIGDNIIMIIANDKFQPLANFWSICKNNNAQLHKKLYEKINTISKDTFIELRNNIVTQQPNLVENSLQQAIDYFIINRCSFSGATLSGGFSQEASKKRFTKTSIDKIKNLDLSKFSIHNKDFTDFINDNIPNKSLIFLDPPYYLENGSKLYGNNGDMHEHFDHKKLYECISQHKHWIMTYNNCDYIKRLYKDYKILEIDWAYGMNKSKKSSEIVIICV